MRDRRKSREEEMKGAPDWVVTFSDITSLLVTFFVLILTFSTLEPEKKDKAVGFLRGAMGVMTQEHESSRRSISKDDSNLSQREKEMGTDMPFARNLDKLEGDIEELKVRLMAGEELKLDRIDGALRIRLRGDRLFNPGSHALREDFHTLVSKLADTIGYYENRIVVEGHTDSSFTGTNEFSPGYELAGQMAMCVAEVLVRDGQINRERISVASYGASRPIATNDTPLGRARNRRVDILVLEDSRGR
jgi:chemotaxis protein MotB